MKVNRLCDHCWLEVSSDGESDDEREGGEEGRAAAGTEGTGRMMPYTPLLPPVR